MYPVASCGEMLGAWDRRDRPPEEGAAAALQGFAVDKTFLSSFKGILLEIELVTAASLTLHAFIPPLPRGSSLEHSLCPGCSALTSRFQLQQEGLKLD